MRHFVYSPGFLAAFEKNRDLAARNKAVAVSFSLEMGSVIYTVYSLPISFINSYNNSSLGKDMLRLMRNFFFKRGDSWDYK